MPFTTQQLAVAADYALAAYQKKEPIDQINFQHVTLDWLMRNKEVSSFVGGSFKEPIYVTNNSNYQRYFGADQVTYNERDPVDWTDFPHYNIHDGFWFDEDTLLAAGITLLDDTSAVPTANEKEVLIDRLKVSYRALKDSLQEGLAYDIYRDGSQSTKAVPGLASIVDPTPATGTVGGIDASVATYWQNNANTGVTGSAIIAEMEESWAACIRYGGMKPDFIVAGRAFYDNFVQYTAAAVQRHQAVQGRGGAMMDASVEAVNFRGVPVVWDPTLDALDSLLSTTTYTKTAYMLNSKAIKLRPVKGNWMVNRRPERLPDRYVHYFAKTAKFGLTVNKRNALAVITIA